MTFVGACRRSVLVPRQATSGSNPTSVPKKVVASLRREEQHVYWPALSTAGNILDRTGQVRPRKRRLRAAPLSEPFAAGHKPNDVWAIDLKVWFPLAIDLA